MSSATVLPINLLFSREAIVALVNAVGAKILFTPPPGAPGGLFEKVEGMRDAGADAQAHRRAAARRSCGVRWRNDFADCRRRQRSRSFAGKNRRAVADRRHHRGAQDRAADPPQYRRLLDRRHAGGGDRPGGPFFGGFADIPCRRRLLHQPARARGRRRDRDPDRGRIPQSRSGRQPLAHHRGAGRDAGRRRADHDRSRGGRAARWRRPQPPASLHRRRIDLSAGDREALPRGLAERLSAPDLWHDGIRRLDHANPARPRASARIRGLAGRARGTRRAGRRRAAPRPCDADRRDSCQGTADVLRLFRTPAGSPPSIRAGCAAEISGGSVPHGEVYITGRAKDLIIRGGHNIDPTGIEDVALRFPGVALAAAVGRPDPYAGETPMLFVTPAPGAAIDRAALADFLHGGRHGAAGAAARDRGDHGNAGDAGRQDLQAATARNRRGSGGAGRACGRTAGRGLPCRSRA